MPEIAVDGGTLCYQTFGSGAIPVVLTPGGRWAGYVQNVVGNELAKDFLVITWDRRNTDGDSSFLIEGDRSEADLWADDLASLIEAIGIGPCYVGEYAGCRTSPILCTKRPDLVRGMMLAWPSGGQTPAESVPRTVYRPYLQAALRSGMEGVLKVGSFARSIARKPGNAARLIAMRATDFVRQMAYWEACFTTTGDLATAGCRLSDEEWASIKVPTSITGGIDPVHPSAAATRIHQLLPQSYLHDAVVTTAEWDAHFGVLPYPKVSDLQGQRIAPVWRDFIRMNEG